MYPPDNGLMIRVARIEAKLEKIEKIALAIAHHYYIKPFSLNIRYCTLCDSYWKNFEKPNHNPKCILN